mmetsp:Transcript_50924/g.103529  ORF Transcript_50924/g.103529 Transcript_50924/m.103529 type:complete len:268 (+) Transcript_50924:524-1327(+)
MSKEARPDSSGSWGLYLIKPARRGELAEEYCGEVISRATFWDRFQRTRPGDGLYFCQLKGDWILDASAAGSYGRFAQHSCKPTAALVKRIVKGWWRVALEMLVDGDAGTPVTVSYNWVGGILRWKCECGEAECSGFIDRLPKARQPEADPEGAEGLLLRREAWTGELTTPSPPDRPNRKGRRLEPVAEDEGGEEEDSGQGGETESESTSSVECLGAWMSGEWEPDVVDGAPGDIIPHGDKDSDLDDDGRAVETSSLEAGVREEGSGD